MMSHKPSLRLLAALLLTLSVACGNAENGDDESAPIGPTAVGESWDAMCVNAGVPSAAEDSAGALLRSAGALWSAERAAFRQYQSTFCEECAMFEASASEFFASSSALVRRIAQRFPQSAFVACAEGMMHYRAASLGEGSFDEPRLAEAVASFERALRLNPPPLLEQRLFVEIGDASSLLRQP